MTAVNSTVAIPPLTVDTPQRKETNPSQNTNNDIPSEADQAVQEAIANFITSQAFSLMVRQSAMTKNAMNKGSQGIKELMAEIEKEENDRKAEEGIPEY